MPLDDYSADALVDILDGCSGGVTAFYTRFLGRDIGCRYCCDEHDVAYYEGGMWIDRKLADRRFRQCVYDSGRPIRAWLFWVAVRLFGSRYWNLTENDDYGRTDQS